MSRSFQRGLFLVLVLSLLGTYSFAQVSPAVESSNFTVNTAVPRIDSDKDGMPDAWEVAHGLNPLVADAGGNPDGDALTNIEEYNAGTDPQIFESNTLAFAVSSSFTVQTKTLVPDQDGDGLPDAWEIANGLNPALSNAAADPDGDGLPNLDEYNGGWNPKVAEVAGVSTTQSSVFLMDMGAYALGFAADSDRDGMPDWWEVKYGLNLLVNDAAGNLDGDDLTNLQEYLAGRIPNRDDQSGEGTQPSVLFALDTIGLAPDLDHDGLPDAWEIANGLNPMVANAGVDLDGDGRTNIEEYNANTNPNVNDWRGPASMASLSFLLDTGAYKGGYLLDSDKDGMPDWWEARYGLPINQSNAGDDSDQDGLTNIEEYRAGTNPGVRDLLFGVTAQGNLFLLDTGGAWLDSDGDGIPDWWERKYTGSTREMKSIDDPDGDGKSNLEEYLADQSPVSALSRFNISSSSIQAGPNGPEFVIQWDSKPGRIYRVFVSNNPGTWPVAADYEIAGDGSTKTCACPIAGASRLFFKVEVHVVHP